MTKDPALTIPDLSRDMNLSSATISKIIRRMKATGRLSREGSNKTGKWVVRSTI